MRAIVCVPPSTAPTQLSFRVVGGMPKLATGERRHVLERHGGASLGHAIRPQKQMWRGTSRLRHGPFSESRSPRRDHRTLAQAYNGALTIQLPWEIESRSSLEET